jgi:hypothetical protein
MIALYRKIIPTRGALTVVVVGFLVAEVGQRVHLDPPLIVLAAGMFVRQCDGQGGIQRGDAGVVFARRKSCATLN